MEWVKDIKNVFIKCDFERFFFKICQEQKEKWNIKHVFKTIKKHQGNDKE